MKIEFESTYDDCLAATLASTKRHRNYEHWFFFWRWQMAGLALATTGWLWWDEIGGSSLVVGLGIGAIVAQVMPWLLERRLITRIHTHLMDPRARATVLGKRTAEALPEGLKLSSPKRDVFYKWAMVESIERQQSRILVLVEGFDGIAIPASATGADAFIAEARRLLSR